MNTQPGMSTPPPLPPRNGGGGGKSGALTWLWILLGGLGLVVIGGMVAMGFWFANVVERIESGTMVWGPAEVSEVGWLEDREGHVTAWYGEEEMAGKFEAVGEADVPPEGEFEVVKYGSPAGELVAYLTPDPGDGERRPAVIWAKGGFGGIGDFLWEEAEADNDQSARAFLDAGLVVMCPSWRGENDNPGRFELFYGEVEDLLAAVEYVKGLPYVDAERVYLAGHSTGGTMVLMAAVAGADVRAVFSFGGNVDVGGDLEFFDPYDNVPYDRDKDKRGNELRSAMRYTPFLEAPVFYFEGKEDFYGEMRQMELTAVKHGVEFAAFEVPGDHFNILAPVTALVAEKILEDTGETCGIGFTDGELAEAWRAVHDKPVDEVLRRWMAEGGDLDVMLGELGDGVGADDVKDVRAMGELVRELVEMEGDEAARDLARVVALIRPTTDDDALEAFDDRVVAEVRAWVREKSEGELTPVEAKALFGVLESLVINYDGEVAAMVLELVRSDFRAGSRGWGELFAYLEPGDEMFEEVVAGLRAGLPEGEMGVSVMHWSSHAMYEDEGEWEGAHLFDSEEGKERLRGYLGSEEGGAFEAGFALAFVGDAVRDGLVELGLEHPRTEVRMEVAWADLKTGGERGVAALVEASRELEFSRTAVAYLEEFEKGEAVPAEVREEEFAAKAEMAGWLKHPNELGEMPETLEVYDTREIFWPPTEEKETVWLMKFSYRFDEDEPVETGYGMVGGGWTWSSFKEYETAPTPEELYAHHCAVELGWAAKEEVSDEEAREVLREGNPGMFGGGE